MGEEEPFTVHISRSLVNQLLEEEAVRVRKVKRPKPKPAPAHTSKVSAAAGVVPGASPGHVPVPRPPASAAITTPSVRPPQPQPTSQYSDPELAAIRSVITESEGLLNRLQKKEDEMVKEVTEKARAVHEREFSIPERKKAACVPEKEACLQCYKENLKNPLKCAQFVRDYSECVRGARISAFSKVKEPQVP